MDIIEISDLDLDSNDNWGGPKKSTNFGGGLEFLMNDKIKDSNKPSSDINLDDLNNLENELNDLVDDDSGPSSSFRPRSDMFNSADEKPSVRFSSESTSNIGRSTAQTAENNKTWDGYAKFNDIPMNPEKVMSSQNFLSLQIE